VKRTIRANIIRAGGRKFDRLTAPGSLSQPKFDRADHAAMRLPFGFGSLASCKRALAKSRSRRPTLRWSMDAAVLKIPHPRSDQREQ